MIGDADLCTWLYMGKTLIYSNQVYANFPFILFIIMSLLLKIWFPTSFLLQLNKISAQVHSLPKLIPDFRGNWIWREIVRAVVPKIIDEVNGRDNFTYKSEFG